MKPSSKFGVNRRQFPRDPLSSAYQPLKSLKVPASSATLVQKRAREAISRGWPKHNSLFPTPQTERRGQNPRVSFFHRSKLTDVVCSLRKDAQHEFADMQDNCVESPSSQQKGEDLLQIPASSGFPPALMSSANATRSAVAGLFVDVANKADFHGIPQS